MAPRDGELPSAAGEWHLVRDCFLALKDKLAQPYWRLKGLGEGFFRDRIPTTTELLLWLGGLIPEQLAQLTGGRLAQRYLRPGGVFQAQVEAVAGVGDHFLHVLQVDKIATVSAEEAAAR